MTSFIKRVFSPPQAAAARLEALENDNVGFDVVDGDKDDEAYQVDQDDGKNAKPSLSCVKLG